MIKIDNLTKNYGKNRGCTNVDLQINDGEIFALVGPNGAGKSTIIKCMLDLINITSGKVLFDGKEVKRSDSTLRESIGYLPGEVYLYDDLKVSELFKYNASFYKTDCKEKTKELVKLLNVDTSKKISELSLGNLKKVGIINCLMHDPKYIIMDESTSGLDPLMQEVFFDLLRKEKAAGKTIFFSTHILSEVKKICDRVGVIKEGKIIKVDEVDNFNNAGSQRVELISDDLDKLKFEHVIKQEDDRVVFMYSGSYDDLIKELSKIHVKSLLIEEAAIEDVFMHFYKGEV